MVGGRPRPSPHLAWLSRKQSDKPAQSASFCRLTVSTCEAMQSTTRPNSRLQTVGTPTSRAAPTTEEKTVE